MSESQNLGLALHAVVELVLPVFGLAILVFSLAAMVFPFGHNLTTRPPSQVIKGFGIDLQVSILTLLLIIGSLLTLSAVFFLNRQYDSTVQQLIESKARLASAETAFSKALDAARRIDIRALITLSGVVPESMPLLENVECQYFVFGSNTPARVSVEPGIRSNQFTILLTDVAPSTQIDRLLCRDRQRQRSWALEHFMPLQPALVLGEDRP